MGFIVVRATGTPFERGRAIGRGLGQGIHDALGFANAFEEIYGQVELGTPTPQPLERCTDVVLDGPDGPLLGHTEQWYAGDQGAVGIVVDVADDGPTVLAPVVAGTLPLVGINGSGVTIASGHACTGTLADLSSRT